MRHIRSAALLLAASLGPTMIAIAGTIGAFDVPNAPGASTPVAAISDRVTYAKPGESLKTYVAFNVGSGAYLFKNISGNTLNNLTVTFTASVTDSNEKLKLFDAATYLSSLSGCTIPSDSQNPLVISCQIRQMKAGDSFGAPFTVFYEAPAQFVGGAGDVADTDKVKLDIEIAYAEGGSGGNPTRNSILPIAMADADAVILGTDNPTFVRSAVPNSGATLFTGDQGISKSGDRFTTLVTIPDILAPYTTAQIKEGVYDDLNCGSFFVCSQSELKIPLPAGQVAFQPYLTIVLRQDKENIRPGTKIGGVLLQYVDGDGVAHYINQCASGDVVAGPLAIPCISVVKPPKYYKNRSVDGWTLELDGDFEWTLIAPHNGFIRFPS